MDLYRESIELYGVCLKEEFFLKSRNALGVIISYIDI